MDIVQNDTTICQGDSIELSVLTNPSTFINWRNGFPNNNSRKICFNTERFGPDGTWEDKSPTTWIEYIMEIETSFDPGQILDLITWVIITAVIINLRPVNTGKML